MLFSVDERLSEIDQEDSLAYTKLSQQLQNDFDRNLIDRVNDVKSDVSK